MQNILSNDDFIEAVQSFEWTFAKTMPHIPHEYIVRGKTADEDTYVAMYYAIDLRGEPGDWNGTQYKYLRPGDGYKYWKMTDDVNKSVIINRAYDESSQEKYTNMLNFGGLEYGNRIRLIDTDGDVFKGYVIDTFLAEDCSDLMKHENGISIMADDGRHMLFYESEIESVERLVYNYVHDEVICTSADETIYHKQCEEIEDYLLGLQKQTELRDVDSTLIQQYTYNGKRIVIINNIAAGQVQLKSEIPLKHFFDKTANSTVSETNE